MNNPRELTLENMLHPGLLLHPPQDDKPRIISIESLQSIAETLGCTVPELEMRVFTTQETLSPIGVINTNNNDLALNDYINITEDGILAGIITGAALIITPDVVPHIMETFHRHKLAIISHEYARLTISSLLQPEEVDVIEYASRINEDKPAQENPAPNRRIRKFINKALRGAIGGKP